VTDSVPLPAPRLLVLGLGLIGGSFALALRRAAVVSHIAGVDAVPATAAAALRRGVIDTAYADLQEAFAAARFDVVVLAVPVCAAESVIVELVALCAAQAVPPVLTDVGSVKENLLAALRMGGVGPPPWLVPAHPIAGSEHSGVAAARADLFDCHRVILTPTAASSAAARAAVRSLWEACGAEVVEMDAAAHDRILALTSHLPHVLAFALVDALAQQPEQAELFRFAAGGFRDFTRIASSDPVMWRDIALANREALLAALDVFSSQTEALRTAIADSDGATLGAVFSRAKAARDSFIDPAAQRRGSAQ